MTPSSSKPTPPTRSDEKVGKPGDGKADESAEARKDRVLEQVATMHKLGFLRYASDDKAKAKGDK